MIRSRSIVGLFPLLALYLIRCPTLVVAGTRVSYNAAPKAVALRTKHPHVAATSEMYDT